MRFRWLEATLIVVACIIAYANMFPNELVWDDNMFIRDNYFIKNFSNITKVFGVDFWETSIKAQKGTFYRPLITASLIVDFAIWKLNTFGYHLTNLLFFILCCLMVWLSAGFFLSRQAALIAGILFAVHAIHTESVTFILGRTDVFAGCFMFASMYFFLRSDTKTSQPMQSISFWASVVLFLTSLFCKESSIMALPVFCVGSAYLHRKKNTLNLRRLVIMMIPFAVVLGFYLIVRQLVYAGPVKYGHLPPGGSTFNTLVTMPKIVLMYIGKLFLPIGLSIDYQPAVVTSLLSPRFFVPFITVIALATWSVIRSTRTLPAYSVFCFFITILPVMNFIPIGLFIADRFLFIPSFGFVLFAGWVYDWMSTNARLRSYRLNLPLIAILSIISLLTILTVRRNADWYNALSLWSKTAQTTPASFRAHGSLGQIFLNRGMTQAALEETQRALLFHPNDPRVLGNLGIIHMRMQQYKEAVHYFERSLERDPTDFRSYANLFVIYAQLDSPNRAVEAITRALECNPAHRELWNRKALYLVGLKRYDEARDTYITALKHVPPDNDLLFGLGDLYKNVYNNPAMAANIYKKILAIDPGNVKAKQLFYSCVNR